MSQIGNSVTTHSHFPADLWIYSSDARTAWAIGHKASEERQVALDQYKTQVLLLHSEQSTLDSLSSGFSDRYTVHCATSGSEALNTLVETPINVIITAQQLPGMSGLEALREARKRSPETIGILLAGSGDEGLARGRQPLLDLLAPRARAIAACSIRGSSPR